MSAITPKRDDVEGLWRALDGVSMSHDSGCPADVDGRCECAERIDTALTEERAWLEAECARLEAGRAALSECVHCHDLIPTEEKAHWKACPKHPAHAALAALLDENERLREALERIEYLCQGVQGSSEIQDCARAALAGSDSVKPPASSQGKP